jgi:hypothetical protein
MRRWLFLLLFASFGLGNTGCLLNRYSPDPEVRIRQLLVDSENLRVIQEEVDRFWMTDHPSTLTPFRVSGVVGP